MLFSHHMIDNKTTLLPRHLAIIMDGNGRWAKSRKLPRVAGHREGARTVDKTVTYCRKMGIKVLTLFAFSSQNWSRPSLEIKALMALLSDYITSERRTILDNNIRLTAIGALDELPDKPRKALFDLMEVSSSNTGMTLCLALSYGGKEEIVAAAKSIAKKVASGELNPDSINSEIFDSHLWSSNLGPVDLLVRTSGEIRVSNFLLWSAAYAEFFFCKKMWPDFMEADIDAAIQAFSNRDRRFGQIDSAKKG